MKLTNREKQLMSLLATGMKDKNIAHCMGISVRTVNAHMRRIFTKTNSSNRTGAIIKYLTNTQNPCSVKIKILRENNEFLL